MSDSIECSTHGWQKRTRVCRHVIDTLVDRKPRGMFWTSDDAEQPNGWCAECHAAYKAAGDEWTDELMQRADPQVLCFSCFKLAQQINGIGVH